MAKLYAKKKTSPMLMQPKKEVVSFLLNYSKSFRVIQTKTQLVELHLN